MRAAEATGAYKRFLGSSFLSGIISSTYQPAKSASDMDMLAFGPKKAVRLAAQS